MTVLAKKADSVQELLAKVHTFVEDDDDGRWTTILSGDHFMEEVLGTTTGTLLSGESTSRLQRFARDLEIARRAVGERADRLAEASLAYWRRELGWLGQRAARGACDGMH